MGMQGMRVTVASVGPWEALLGLSIRVERCKSRMFHLFFGHLCLLKIVMDCVNSLAWGKLSWFHSSVLKSMTWAGPSHMCFGRWMHLMLTCRSIEEKPKGNRQ